MRSRLRRVSPADKGPDHVLYASHMILEAHGAFEPCRGLQFPQRPYRLRNVNSLSIGAGRGGGRSHIGDTYGPIS
jgi:hypothetical protein